MLSVLLQLWMWWWTSLSMLSLKDCHRLCQPVCASQEPHWLETSLCQFPLKMELQVLQILCAIPYSLSLTCSNKIPRHWSLWYFFSLDQSDYVGFTGRIIIIGSGTNEQCVDITIVDDALTEGPESFLFTIPSNQADPAAFVPENANTATITILDDGKLKES